MIRAIAGISQPKYSSVDVNAHSALPLTQIHGCLFSDTTELRKGTHGARPLLVTFSRSPVLINAALDGQQLEREIVLVSEARHELHRRKRPFYRIDSNRFKEGPVSKLYIEKSGVMLASPAYK